MQYGLMYKYRDIDPNSIKGFEVKKMNVDKNKNQGYVMCVLLNC